MQSTASVYPHRPVPATYVSWICPGSAVRAERTVRADKAVRAVRAVRLERAVKGGAGG